MESALIASPGKKLLALVKGLGLSQAEVARQLGISRNLVNAWHLGRRRITYDHYRELLRLTNSELHTQLNARALRGDPQTREALQDDLDFYSLIYEALAEWQQVRAEVMDTLTQAHQILYTQPHIPAEQWTPHTQDVLLDAAAMLVAYSKVRQNVDEFGDLLLQEHCAAKIDRLRILEEGLPDASQND
jgi:transcriptional regulator with XRE-family HTH domain